MEEEPDADPLQQGDPSRIRSVLFHDLDEVAVVEEDGHNHGYCRGRGEAGRRDLEVVAYVAIEGGALLDEESVHLSEHGGRNDRSNPYGKQAQHLFGLLHFGNRAEHPWRPNWTNNFYSGFVQKSQGIRGKDSELVMIRFMELDQILGNSHVPFPGGGHEHSGHSCERTAVDNFVPVERSASEED